VLLGVEGGELVGVVMVVGGTRQEVKVAAAI